MLEKLFIILIFLLKIMVTDALGLLLLFKNII